MVFGRSKKPIVNGLRSDEQILWNMKGRNKTGFLKSQKIILVLTNKRAMYADENSKNIIQWCNLDEVTPVVSNRQSQSTTNGYGTNLNITHKEWGDLGFIKNGEQVLGFTNIEKPDELLDQIQAITRSKISLGDYVSPGRGSLPKVEQQKSPPKASEDPLAILKLRFAKGEITKEEFEEMKKIL